MRDFPPLYSAILRALADALSDALTVNLPARNPEQRDDAPTLRDCAATQQLSERR